VGTDERVQQIVNAIDRIEDTDPAKLQEQTIAGIRVIESAASYTIPLTLRVACGDHRQRLGARRMHDVRDAAASSAQPV